MTKKLILVPLDEDEYLALKKYAEEFDHGRNLGAALRGGFRQACTTHHEITGDDFFADAEETEAPDAEENAPAAPRRAKAQVIGNLASPAAQHVTAAERVRASGARRRAQVLATGEMTDPNEKPRFNGGRSMRAAKE